MMEMNGKHRDEILELVEEMMEKDRERVTVLNGKRVREMQRCYAMLEPMVRACNAWICSEQQELFRTMGSIWIEGEGLRFGDPAAFAEAVSLAGNVEIFPLSSGDVRMVLNFYDLSTYVD